MGKSRHLVKRPVTEARAQAIAEETMLVPWPPWPCQGPERQPNRRSRPLSVSLELKSSWSKEEWVYLDPSRGPRRNPVVLHVLELSWNKVLPPQRG
jgi:hypothetical protein